jgi:hypothetical protein
MANDAHLWGQANGGWRRTRCGSTFPDRDVYGTIQDVPLDRHLCDTCRGDAEREALLVRTAGFTILPG